MKTNNIARPAHRLPLHILAMLILPVVLSGSALAQSGESQPPRAAARSPGDTLVTWRNLALSRQDFEVEMQKLPADLRDDFRRNPKRITKRLEDMLVVRTMASEAEELGLAKDPEIMTRIRLAREEILYGAMTAYVRSKTPIPDLTSQAEDHYKLHKGDFQVKEQVRVSHILVDTRKRTEDEAKALADRLREQLAAGGDVQPLAIEHSDDPSAKRNGGDLGMMARGRTVKEFEDAAFALKKPGDVSDVVKTRFGYHVIRLTERIEERQKPFEEVKDAIIKTLIAELRADAVLKHMADIRQDKSIKLNATAIDALETPAAK